MTIAHRVHQFLNGQHIPYDTVGHSPSHSSVQSAIAAQIPLQRVAKAVILKDHIDNYVMALIPASNRVKVKQINQLTDTRLRLASENEVNHQFTDCQNGAIPPIGPAYNMEMVWDNRLGKIPDVYLEAGDHETLIHLSQKSFQKIVAGTLHDDLCSPPGRTQEDCLSGINP